MTKYDSFTLKLWCNKLLIILFSLMIVFQKVPSSYAALPTVVGRVEALLPSGERIPLPGIYIYRMDWFGWSYCLQGGRNYKPCEANASTYCCFGDQDGVTVITDTNGNYSFGDQGNNPPPATACIGSDTIGTRCLIGPKGSLPVYQGQKCDALNWCGPACGSNPHNFEPYFPTGYQLPGNLTALGFTINDGFWDPPSRELSVANSGNVLSGMNFTFVFLGANPEEETLDCRSVNPAVVFPTRVPSPTIPWSAQMGSIDQSGSFGKSNQEFENIIENWKQDKISASQISIFIENLSRVPGLQKTICDPTKEDGCAGPER